MQRGGGGPLTGAGELCARLRKRRCSLLWAQANPDAPPARGQQGRELLEQRDCVSLNTPPTAVGPVLGPASQAPRAVPGAPEWRSPPRELSGTPAPDACRHTSRRPTRPARTSCVAAPRKSHRGVHSFFGSSTVAANDGSSPPAPPSLGGAVAEHVEGKTEVRTNEILSTCLNIARDRQGRAEEMRVASTLNLLGFRSARVPGRDGKRERI